MVSVINEEGKLIEGLEPTLLIEDEDGEIIDVVMGPVVILGTDNEGNFKEPTARQTSLFLASLAVCNTYETVHKLTGETTKTFGLPAKLKIRDDFNTWLDDLLS